MVMFSNTKIFLFLSVCTIIAITLTSCQKSQNLQHRINPESGVPPLTLSAKNIVVTQDEYTSEPCGSGRLHVWNYNNGNYENTWTAKTFSNYLVKIGDIDGDTKREIITLASCSETELKRGENSEYHKFFLCVYKEDEQTAQNEMGLWKTTYYDDLKNNIKEDENFWPKEMTLSDINNDGIDEIIVITGHWLTIYTYDSQAVYAYNNSKGVLKKIAEFKPNVAKNPIRLKSVTVANVDEQRGKEIIISANQERREDYGYGFYGWYADKSGYIFIHNFRNGTLELLSHLSVVAFLTNQSIRTGDLDNDGALELCSSGYKQAGDLLQGYLFIWDHNSEWELHEIPIGVPENLGVNYHRETNAPWNHIDVGELNSNHPGDEIVIALQNQMLVTLCYWKGGKELTTINNVTLYEYFYVRIDSISIADSDGDIKNDIIVSGTGKSNPNSGRFYLEIFDQDLIRKWYRLGGYPRETEIRSAAIG